jgi:hypothetical protein
MPDDDQPKISPLARALAADIWITRFPPSLKEHIYALGVVASNFNSLEFALLALFYEFLGLDDVTTRYLFHYLNNSRRIDILTRAVEAREYNPDIKDRIVWFVQCFNICVENRNFLMHGMTDSTWDALTLHSAVTDILTIKKSPRNDPIKTNYLHLTERQIRSIADNIYTTEMFGLEVYLFASARKNGGVITYVWEGSEMTRMPTLPEKPPLPSNLSLSDSPTPRDDSPQPEPSQE